MPCLPLDELPHAHSQRRHPDVVSAADAHAEGERRRRRSSRRGLRNWNAAAGRYPGRGLQHQQRGAEPRRDHRQRGARNDNGDYRIRIYTIGMGELVRYNLGTMPEKPEDILKRIANDTTSPDFNEDQLEGEVLLRRRRRPTSARRSRRCRTRSSA